MKALPTSTTDDEIFAFLDAWMELVKAEKYEEAFACVDCYPGSGWTPNNIRDAVKGFGTKQRTQKLIIRGASAKIAHVRQLLRWKGPRNGYFATLLYPMNLKDVSLKFMASFLLHLSEEGISVQLNDIFEP
jgi:hypothetical protein